MPEKPEIDYEKFYKKEKRFKVKHHYGPISSPCCGHCIFLDFGYEGEIYCKKIQEIHPNFSGGGVSSTCACDLFEPEGKP